MDIKLDLDGIAEVQKRWKRHNPDDEDYGTMDAETAEAVLIMAKDDRLLYRALSSYFADKAKNAEEIFIGYVAQHHEGVPHKDVPFLQPGADSRVRAVIPVVTHEVWGEVDASKKMPIVKLFANYVESEQFHYEGEKKILVHRKEREKLLAKYRYSPKADKLSRIG